MLADSEGREAHLGLSPAVGSHWNRPTCHQMASLAVIFSVQNLTSTGTLPGPLMGTYDALPNSLAVDPLVSRLDAWPPKIHDAAASMFFSLQQLFLKIVNGSLGKITHH